MLLKLRPADGGGDTWQTLANAYETPSGRRVTTARVTRRGATGAEQRAPKARVSRTPSGGRVITASYTIKH